MVLEIRALRYIIFTNTRRSFHDYTDGGRQKCRGDRVNFIRTADPAALIYISLYILLYNNSQNQTINTKI